MLYNKWWKSTGTCMRDENKDSKANALGVENVGGIFVVLLVGLALAVMVAICEFIYKSKKNARDEQHAKKVGHFDAVFITGVVYCLIVNVCMSIGKVHHSLCSEYLL